MADESLTSFHKYPSTVLIYTLHCSLEAHLLHSAYPQDALKHAVRGCLRKSFSYVERKHIMSVCESVRLFLAYIDKSVSCQAAYGPSVF